MPKHRQRFFFCSTAICAFVHNKAVAYAGGLRFRHLFVPMPYSRQDFFLDFTTSTTFAMTLFSAIFTCRLNVLEFDKIMAEFFHNYHAVVLAATAAHVSFAALRFACRIIRYNPIRAIIMTELLDNALCAVIANRTFLVICKTVFYTSRSLSLYKS